MDRKNKYNLNRKVFLQSIFNMVKDSEFMESVMMELLENYNQNTDEINEIEFDETLLPEMLHKAIELEWYELCVKIHKHIEKLKQNVKEK